MHSCRIFILLFCIFGLTTSLSGVDRTWIGTTGGGDEATASDGNNWTDAAAPGVGDNAHVNGGTANNIPWNIATVNSLNLVGTYTASVTLITNLTSNAYLTILTNPVYLGSEGWSGSATEGGGDGGAINMLLQIYRFFKLELFFLYFQRLN